MSPDDHENGIIVPEKPAPIIFNLTRLLSRSQSATPTGVDRVDLRHARFALDQATKREVVFVYQQRDVLRPLPERAAQALIETLWSRWVLSQASAALPPPGLIRRFVRWLDMRAKRKLGHFIAPAIRRRVEGRSPPIYLNSGHSGLHHLHLHEKLIAELGARPVYYLHDLIPIDYPEYTSAVSGPATHRKRIETMARTAACVLANSEHTRTRFLRYCEAEGLPTPATRVLHIGVEEHIIEAAGQQPTRGSEHAPELQAPYFVVVGTIEPRKNHLLLLHTWRRLGAELGTECPKLVIVGKRGWNNQCVFEMLDRSIQLRPHIVELNSVTDDAMISVVKGAQALLFPSHEEGWGIPITEALTLRTPVICSDIPAFRECSQQAATFVDALDAPEWRRQIIAHCQHPKRASGEFRPVPWEHHYAAFEEAIEAVAHPL